MFCFFELPASLPIAVNDRSSDRCHRITAGAWDVNGLLSNSDHGLHFEPSEAGQGGVMEFSEAGC